MVILNLAEIHDTRSGSTVRLERDTNISGRLVICMTLFPTDESRTDSPRWPVLFSTKTRCPRCGHPQFVHTNRSQIDKRLGLW